MAPPRVLRSARPRRRYRTGRWRCYAIRRSLLSSRREAQTGHRRRGQQQSGRTTARAATGRPGPAHLRKPCADPPTGQRGRPELCACSIFATPRPPRRRPPPRRRSALLAQGRSRTLQQVGGETARSWPPDEAGRPPRHRSPRPRRAHRKLVDQRDGGDPSGPQPLVSEQIRPRAGQERSRLDSASRAEPPRLGPPVVHRGADLAHSSPEPLQQPAQGARGMSRNGCGGCASGWGAALVRSVVARRRTVLRGSATIFSRALNPA